MQFELDSATKKCWSGEVPIKWIQSTTMTVLIIITLCTVACLHSTVDRCIEWVWLCLFLSLYLSLRLLFVLCSGSGAHQNWQNVTTMSIESDNEWKKTEALTRKCRENGSKKHVRLQLMPELPEANGQTIFRRCRRRFCRQQMAEIKFGIPTRGAHEVRKHPCIPIQISDGTALFREIKQ